MKGFRFGIYTPQWKPYQVLLDNWRYFEELGFDSVWPCDHFHNPGHPDKPFFEGWTVLAALAAETSRIRLGVLVSSNTFRHPALLAQQAITLDHISEGRLDFGVGAGWYELEHEWFRIPLYEPKVRVDRFSEAMEIIDPLMRGETVSYEGQHYQLTEARLQPPPVQSPRPPFMLAGHRPRMLGICARFADSWNSTGTVEDLTERNRQVDEACRRIGRDPSEIVRSYLGGNSTLGPQGLPDMWSSPDAFSEVVGRYAEAGVNEFLFVEPRPEQYKMVERIVSRVIEPSR